MNHEFYIAMGTFILGILGLWWRVGTEVNNKIGRVYSRLDECKTGFELHVDQNFVRQEVFKLAMEHIDRDFGRLERKLDSINDKLDKLIEAKHG